MLAYKEFKSVPLYKMGQCLSPKFSLKSAFDVRSTLAFLKAASQCLFSSVLLLFSLFLFFNKCEILDKTIAKKLSTVMCLFSCFALDCHRHLCLGVKVQFSGRNIFFSYIRFTCMLHLHYMSMIAMQN